MRTKQEIAEAALTAAERVTPRAGLLARLVRTLAELVHDLALADEQADSQNVDDLWTTIISRAERNGFHVTRTFSCALETVTASGSGCSFTGTAREVDAYLIGWERCAKNEGR